jgi:hypothetical protein
MGITSLIDQIGDDIDLVTRSDDWLRMERQHKASAASRLLDELKAIDLARELKQRLQQQNLVVSQTIGTDGIAVTDVTFSINSAQAAANRVPINPIDQAAHEAQKAVWRQDGHDIK